MTEYEATHFSASAGLSIVSDTPETGEQAAVRFGGLLNRGNPFASEGFFAENAAPRTTGHPPPPARDGAGRAQVRRARQLRGHLLIVQQGGRPSLARRRPPPRALAVPEPRPLSSGGHGPRTQVFPQPTSRLGGGGGRRPRIGLGWGGGVRRRVRRGRQWRLAQLPLPVWNGCIPRGGPRGVATAPRCQRVLPLPPPPIRHQWPPIQARVVPIPRRGGQGAQTGIRRNTSLAVQPGPPAEWPAHLTGRAGLRGPSSPSPTSCQAPAPPRGRRPAVSAPRWGARTPRGPERLGPSEQVYSQNGPF